MKTFKLPVRLGQCVYTVTNDGEIIPTLIEKIELTKVSEGQSEFVRRFQEGFDGAGYASGDVTFTTLLHSFQNTFLTFDKAYDEALEILKSWLQSEDITIKKRNEYQEHLDHLKNNKEVECRRVNATERFSENSRMSLDLDRNDRTYTQADFPKHYIEPGELVWVAGLKEWKLIRSHITGVKLQHGWSMNLAYICGSSGPISREEVFRTKKGAMNALVRQFRRKFPGDLDPKRVQIVDQESEDDKLRTRRAVISV